MSGSDNVKLISCRDRSINSLRWFEEWRNVKCGFHEQRKCHTCGGGGGTRSLGMTDDMSTFRKRLTTPSTFLKAPRVFLQPAATKRYEHIIAGRCWLQYSYVRSNGLRGYNG